MRGLTDRPDDDRPADVHAMGLVAKRDSDKWRIIWDASSPWEDSVNRHIVIRHKRYVRAAEASAGITRNAGQWVVDMRNAYMNIPTHPLSWGKVGTEWYCN